MCLRVQRIAGLETLLEFEHEDDTLHIPNENVPYCARWPLHGAGQSLVTTSTQIFINASCVKGVTTVQGLH